MDLNGFPSLIIYTSIFLFALGTIFGSFIGCVAGRIVAGEDWIKGRSHCDECGHVLEFIDLIPIVSYIITGSKCRYCKKKLSIKYPLMEALMGIVFVALFLSRKMIDFTLLRNLILSVLLMGLSLIDLDTYTIPDGFIVAGIINWLVFELLNFEKESFIISIVTGVVVLVVMLLLSMIMDKILNKESLGGGDIKLFFVLSLYFGPLKTLFLLLLSCIIGLSFVVFLKNNKIPFGPAISIGTVFMLIYGDTLLKLYLNVI